MADDALAALGRELRAEAEAWLAALTPAAPQGTHAARELLQALGELEAEIGDAASADVELSRLGEWLTAGFFAGPEPAAGPGDDPADAPAAESRADAPPARPASAPSPHDRAGTRTDAAGTERASPPAEYGEPDSRSRVARSGAATEYGEPDTRVRTAAEGDRPPARDSDGERPPSRTAETGDDHGPSPAYLQPKRVQDAHPPTEQDRLNRQEIPAMRPPAGGIQGLSALAALAGGGGVELPEVREDAHPPATSDGSMPSARGAMDDSRVGGIGRRAARDREDSANPPARRGAVERDGFGSASADRPHADRAGPMNPRSATTRMRPEADRGGMEAGRPTPPIIRLPFTPAAAEDRDDTEPGTPPRPLPIPFQAPPGDAETADGDEPAPGRRAVSGARAIAMPGMRLVAENPEDARSRSRGSTGWEEGPGPVHPGNAGWATGAEPRESTDAFLARAARVAERRRPPVADAASQARGPAPAPPPALAVPSPVPPPESQPEPAQWVRRTETEISRLEEPPEWPGPDLADLLDALADEIAHEYRRYYGE